MRLSNYHDDNDDGKDDDANDDDDDDDNDNKDDDDDNDGNYITREPLLGCTRQMVSTVSSGPGRKPQTSYHWHIIIGFTVDQCQ